MENNDIPLSPVGVEDPNIHTIAVNGLHFNIAIELKLIVLLGASINSINSEYRQFNVDARLTNQLIKLQCPDKQINKFFQTIKKAIDSNIKKGVLIQEQNELSNIAHKGIDYAIIYFLLLKHLNYREEEFVNLNSFTTIIPYLDMFDKIINSDKIVISSAQLKAFADFLLKFEKIKHPIGSKLFSVTRFQIENINDLSQPIWKSMYINRIIRNLSIEQRKPFFSPSIGWGVIRCVAKQLFTNSNLINQVTFGENLDYIRNSSLKQNQLASELMMGHIYESALKDIKKVTNELKLMTFDIDYHLGNLCIVIFYPHVGNTIYHEMNTFIEKCKMQNRLFSDGICYKIITNENSFKKLIFQFLYAIYILAKNGIMHNDPHLNNFLLTKRGNKGGKKEYNLGVHKTVSMDEADFDITIIDYDKSILSHHHSNNFDKTRKIINQEVGIIFDTVKKTIVDDYNQVFNCYVMYDVIRFGLVMKSILEDVSRMIGHLVQPNTMKENIAFLDTMIKMSTDTLYLIYPSNQKLPFDTSISQGSIEWLITTLYKNNMKVNKTKSSILMSSQIVKMHSTVSGDKPEFISSRRKYTDALKYNYISQYVSHLTKSYK